MNYTVYLIFALTAGDDVAITNTVTGKNYFTSKEEAEKEYWERKKTWEYLDFVELTFTKCESETELADRVNEYIEDRIEGRIEPSE